MAKSPFSKLPSRLQSADHLCWPTFALLLAAAAAAVAISFAACAAQLSAVSHHYSHPHNYWQQHLQLKQHRLPSTVRRTFAAGSWDKRPLSMSSRVGAMEDNDVVVAPSTTSSTILSPAAASKRGQLEMFSSEATGLGDLEASDAFKKMNKRSISARRPFPAAILGQQHQLSPANDQEERTRLISESTLRKLIDEKRRKTAVRDFTNWLRQVATMTEGSDASKEINENLREDKQGSISSSKPRELSSSFRQLLIPPPANSQQKQQLSSATSVSGRPILVVRRTEELLEQPSVESNTSPNRAGQTGRDNMDASDAFPLLGEFGSQISLLTTRKVQPQKNDNFWVNNNKDNNAIVEQEANAEKGEPVVGRSTANIVIDDGEWLDPISSRVLISLRPPTRPSLIRRNQAAVGPTNRETGSSGVGSSDGGDDYDGNRDQIGLIDSREVSGARDDADGSSSSVTINAEEQRDRDYQQRQQSNEVLIMGLNSNYLPRIARAIM